MRRRSRLRCPLAESAFERLSRGLPAASDRSGVPSGDCSGSTEGRLPWPEEPTLEAAQPLGMQCDNEKASPREIAAGVAETIDKAGRDGIVTAEEDNRDCFCRSFRGEGRRATN